MLPSKQVPRCSPAHVRTNNLVQHRSNVRCKAVLDTNVVHLVQRELTIEGVLHVSTMQAASCMQDFADLQMLSAPGLSSAPHSVQDVLRAASMSGGSSSSSLLTHTRIARAALCVATPDDGFAEDPQALMFGRSMLAPTMSAVRTAGVAGTGSSTLLHCAESSTAWQVSSELWGCQHSADVLQASAAVRRRRRRAFVSVLRAGRGAVRRLAAACDNGTAGGAVDPMPAMCREA